MDSVEYSDSKMDGGDSVGKEDLKSATPVYNDFSNYSCSSRQEVPVIGE